MEHDPQHHRSDVANDNQQNSMTASPTEQAQPVKQEPRKEDLARIAELQEQLRALQKSDDRHKNELDEMRDELDKARKDEKEASLKA